MVNFALGCLSINLINLLQLTPKGWLLCEIKHGNNIENIWEELRKFVLGRAKQEGRKHGIPCLVLKDGGYCITVKEMEVDTDECK